MLLISGNCTKKTRFSSFVSIKYQTGKTTEHDGRVVQKTDMLFRFVLLYIL